MLAWFFDHLATALIASALAALLALIVFFMIRNKKQGKSSCGCGCQSCPMSESCHKK